MSKVYADKNGVQWYDPNNWFERHSDAIAIAIGVSLSLFFGFAAYVIVGACL